MFTRTTLSLVGAVAILCATVQVALSHCEIPCGIYGDKLRIALLLEDIGTVEKSMKTISAMTEKTAHDVNQRSRWIANKEDHANKIQHTVTQYFMTQRVKPKSADDAAAHKKYMKQLTSLHEMLIYAMKCKQTVDVKHCQKLRSLVDQFAEAYFSAEDLKHIREHHGKH